MSAQQPELVQDPDGNKEWHLNGEHHRTDGPAIERKDGYKAWYLNGKQADQFVFG